MPDDIIARAEAALAQRWEQPGPDYPEPVPTGLVWLGDWASEHLPELVDALKTARAQRDEFAAQLDDGVTTSGQTPPWNGLSGRTFTTFWPQRGNEQQRTTLMSDLRAQIREALRSYELDWTYDNKDLYDELAGVVLTLPGVAVVDPEDLWDAQQCVQDWRDSDNCDDTPEYQERLTQLAARLRHACNAAANSAEAVGNG